SPFAAQYSLLTIFAIAPYSNVESLDRDGGKMRLLDSCRLFGTVSLALLAVFVQAQPKEGPEVWSYLASLPPAQRMEVLKREAAREGEVVIYSAIGLDRAKVWLDPFTKENPQVKVEYLRMTTNELAQKTLTEHRAGRTSMDIFMSSSDWLGLVKDTLAPYQPTSWEDLDPRFRHGGTKEGWTAVDFD